MLNWKKKYLRQLSNYDLVYKLKEKKTKKEVDVDLADALKDSSVTYHSIKKKGIDIKKKKDKVK